MTLPVRIKSDGYIIRLLKASVYNRAFWFKRAACNVGLSEDTGVNILQQCGSVHTPT